jgi:hypothetical protein
MDIESIQLLELLKRIFTGSPLIDDIYERLKKMRNIIQSALTPKVFEKQSDGDFNAGHKE